ncbi:hypothetical protein BJ165DRAFT_1449977 [Panaeolus papilionaceus]|nr:hypothetical protein BJ165DRAFT_1449977 [Panaeolus papilionaceus]
MCGTSFEQFIKPRYLKSTECLCTRNRYIETTKFRTRTTFTISMLNLTTCLARVFRMPRLNYTHPTSPSSTNGTPRLTIRLTFSFNGWGSMGSVLAIYMKNQGTSLLSLRKLDHIRHFEPTKDTYIDHIPQY